MQLIHTRVYMRPSTDVQFYQESQEFLDMVNTSYIETGKISEFRKRTFLDTDKLMLEIRSVWPNPTYMKNLQSEPLCLAELEALRDYNLQNKIDFLYEDDSISN